MGRGKLLAVSKLPIHLQTEQPVLNCASSFAKAGTITASWEHQSWQPLAHLAAHEPEAGIHFQSNSNSAMPICAQSSNQR